MTSSMYLNAAGVVLPTIGLGYQKFYATAPYQTITGSGGDDVLYDVAGGDVLIGSGDDNTFVVTDSSTQIYEGYHTGVGVVDTTVNYTLPANVENLTATGWGLAIGGNSGDNIITIYGGEDNVETGGGNDVIDATSSAGRNVFMAGWGAGKEVIDGFNTDTVDSTNDSIEIQGLGITSFAQVQSMLSQQGADVVLKYDANDTITLRNTQLSSINSDDFLFPLNTSQLSSTPTFDEEFNSLTLYNPANPTAGGWKTNFSFGPQSGSNAWESRTEQNELEVYTDPAFTGTTSSALGLNPFSIQNGILTITATEVNPTLAADLGGHNWSSGLITTEKTFAQTYGYFEIRAKLPSGDGMWPAFWMVPVQPDGKTELDVFEQAGGSGSENSVLHTIHDADGTQNKFVTQVATATTAFHTYGVLWTPTRITYYTDGIESGSMATPASMNSPMYMMANLAVSPGGWAGTPDANETSGSMEIDYIHAYSLANAAPAIVQDAGLTLTAPNGTATLVGTESTQTLIAGIGDDTLTGAGVDDTFAFSPGSGLDVITNFSTGDQIDLTKYLSAGGLPTLSASGGNVVVQLGASESITLYGVSLNNIQSTSTGFEFVQSGGNGASMTPAYTPRWSVDNPTDGATSITSPISFSLVGTNAQNLTLTGSGNIWGIANNLNDHLIANSGQDALFAGSGDDILESGSGVDYMKGGTGNDTFYVNNTADRVVAGTGMNQILSSVSYQLPYGVQNLTLTGSANLTGSDNSGNNVITANSGNDIINDGGGNDTLIGGAGNDTFVFTTGSGNDVVSNFHAGDSLNLLAYYYAGIHPTYATAYQGGALVTLDSNDSIFLQQVQPNNLAFTSTGVSYQSS